MIGVKLYKNNQSDMDKYTDCAVWCNANNATIEDKGEYYEVVENVPYMPSQEEKLEQLSSDYQKARFELGVYYMEAVLAGNIEALGELQQDLIALKAQYDEDIACVAGYVVWI